MMGPVCQRLGLVLLSVLLSISTILGQNLAPEFLPNRDLKGFAIKENTPIGTSVYTLEARDPEAAPVIYGIQADFLQVDLSTGVVTVKRTIDYESAPSFYVQIIASDGTSSTKQDVIIQVTDINDEKPLFIGDTFKKSLQEDAVIGTTIIAELSVTDKDTINRLIEVRCAPEKIVDREALDTCDKFGLQTIKASNLNWRGALVLKGTLDYESLTSYQIPIESYDGNPNNNVTISVEITLQPVQDTPPRWVFAPSSSIKENVPVGFPVTLVSAIDGDEGNPRDIRYEIATQQNNYFKMNATSGQISTARDIDRENLDFNQGFVSLTLKAREVTDNSTLPPTLGDDPQTTAITTVRISIEDLNDNPPRFDKSSYVVEIPEDIPTGTALPGLFMTVTDADSGARTSYTLQLVDHTREFEVFPGKGQGTTTVSMKVRDTNLIDYETGPREYRMRVIARENGTAERFSSDTFVTVRITDVNDNAPVFSEQSYTANVFENATENTFIIRVNATDLDTTPTLGTQSIRFSISGTQSNKFKIDPVSGDVTLNSCGGGLCLDYEQVRFYELIVIAKDEDGRGQDVPARLRINVLDVNDNRPFFIIGQYASTIREREVLPDPPVNVQASDPDQNTVIQYSILNQDGTDSNLFQIDQFSGSVTARRPVHFNDTKPNTDEIKITVQASDGINTAVADVTIIVIDINDGPPKFLQDRYEARIPETTRGVVPVTSVSATDTDSSTTGAGIVRYFIDSGDQDKFKINEASGEITTTQNATFNYDTQNEYTMLVKARDNGNPPETGSATVIVYILDRNNRNPYFQPANLRAAVFENVPVNYTVTTITGQDPDRYPDLHYFFTEPMKAYRPTGGEINPAVYDFKSLFSVDETTGIVRTRKKLSRDETSLVTYTILVQDKNATNPQEGRGTLIIDILDVNDKAPIFKEPWNVTNPVYFMNLEEEKLPGTFVRVMVATDPDGAIDRYVMQRNPGQFFAISGQTGEVTVNKRMDFDYDKGNPQPKIFNFTVRAYDNGNNPLYTDATVVVNLININDNTPKFDAGPYSATINESGTPGGSKPGDYVMTVQATDLDAGLFGEVHYGLKNTETRFSIDPTNGTITLLANNLDRETTSEIFFQVLAFDGDVRDQRTASAQVYITLGDINDNPPIFTQDVYMETIPEIFGTRQAILQLSARDKDIKDEGRLVYEPLNTTADMLFYIAPKTGFVQPTRSLQGRAGTYIIPVVVKDNSGNDPYKQDTAEMRIVVQAVTNHPPRWVIPPRDNMTIFVLEEQYLGMIVYDVEADDDDSGKNAIVTYSFETARSDNESRTNEFRINPITGVIQAERVFDREEQDRYTLVLVARDGGGLKSTVFLRIVIKDVNDHLPRFSQQRWELSIPEDHKVNSTVVALTATDADQLPQAKIVFFSIIAGNEDGVFRIDPKRGVIYLNRQLYAEIKTLYILEVKAYNNVSDYSVISKRAVPQNIATVVIRVTDVNDHPPVFTQTSFFSCVSSETALETELLKLTAVDKDSGDDLTYGIVATESTKYFSINRATGVIVNKELMGTMAGQTFTFPVSVTDGKSTVNANVVLFVTSPADEARIVLAQPPEEVRSIKDELERKLQVLLSAKNQNRDTRVCISRIETHINDDASVITAWSDVYFTGMYLSTGNVYRALSAAELTALTKEVVSDPQNAADLGIFYIREVMVQPAVAEAAVFNTTTLIVMIIILILLFLAIILCACCCCCYLPSKRRRDKDKLYGAGDSQYEIEEHRSAEMISGGGVAPVVYDTGFNRSQGFDNRAYVAEQTAVQQTVGHDPVYATVQKKAHTETRETVDRLESERAMESHHQHIETHERIETSPVRTVETSETRIVTAVEPEAYPTGPDVKIITEVIPDEEVRGQREVHVVRQDAIDTDIPMETQAVEVEIREGRGIEVPVHSETRVVQHDEESFIKTSM